MLYNTPRAATIVAINDSILWSLDRATFNYILREASVKKQSYYESFMSKIPLFSEMDPYERSKVVDAFKQASFGADEYIVREGDWGDIFYIIEEGKAVAKKTLEPGKPQEKVKDYNTGDYFGELALLRGEPRAASILSTTPIKCVTLDRFAFKRLLGPFEDILKRNAETYSKIMQSESKWP